MREMLVQRICILSPMGLGSIHRRMGFAAKLRGRDPTVEKIDVPRELGVACRGARRQGKIAQAPAPLDGFLLADSSRTDTAMFDDDLLR